MQHRRHVPEQPKVMHLVADYRQAAMLTFLVGLVYRVVVVVVELTNSAAQEAGVTLLH